MQAMSDKAFKVYAWFVGIFLASYHLALLVLVPYFLVKFGVPTLGILVCTFIFFVLSGLSITGGYHRFYSHRSFKTNKLVEFFLIFFGTLAVQGSVLRWAFDHRLHHAYVDTDKDPYSINRGFWYAHFLWFFDKPIPIDPKLCPDLMKNKMVIFQDKYYGVLALLVNIMVVVGVGFAFHNFFAAFIFAGLFRMFLLHHFTWFINSLAHTWGSKTFSKEHSAVDNYIISLVTFGEGYHNYHHTFCSDYRNGTRWFHFDPTKWLIWGLNKFGMAQNLKTTEVFKAREKQIMYDTKFLIEKAKAQFVNESPIVEQKVASLSSTLLDTLAKMSDLSALYGRLKNNLKEAAPQQKLAQLHSELQKLRANFGIDWSSWLALSKQIVQKKIPA